MTATQELPRVKWRFRFPIGGFVFGMIGGFGVLIFLQQSAVLYPELSTTIAFVLGGGVLTVLVRNVASRVGVSRLNARLTKLERQMATAGAAPVDTAAAAPVAAAPAPVAAAPPVAEPVIEEAVEDVHEPVADPADPWVATHLVPSKGMSAWSEADKSGPPVTQLEAGLELRVLERANGLAHVEAYNGWTAWVDSRSLRRKHG